jgi:hypothetical protein
MIFAVVNGAKRHRQLIAHFELVKPGGKLSLQSRHHRSEKDRNSMRLLVVLCIFCGADVHGGRARLLALASARRLLGRSANPRPHGNGGRSYSAWTRAKEIESRHSLMHRFLQRPVRSDWSLAEENPCDTNTRVETTRPCGTARRNHCHAGWSSLAASSVVTPCEKLPS